jgi:hypothetical protein
MYVAIKCENPSSAFEFRSTLTANIVRRYGGSVISTPNMKHFSEKWLPKIA